jgi:hypothetical protein
MHKNTFDMLGRIGQVMLLTGIAAMLAVLITGALGWSGTQCMAVVVALVIIGGACLFHAGAHESIKGPLIFFVITALLLAVCNTDIPVLSPLARALFRISARNYW